MSRSVLVVDDDPAFNRLLQRFFEQQGWEVYQALSGAQALASYPAHRPDLVLLDLHLLDMSGMEVLDALAVQDATVILVTGHGDLETAVDAMRRGAENFLVKPVRLEHLEAAAEKAVEKVELRRTNRVLAERLSEDHDLSAFGRSRRMQELARQVRLLAATDEATVLLLGESGTGKGWIANVIHTQSRRARGPFVEINCAGLSPSFLDSELFGHEKGAFTDAKTTKRGLFEVSNGGTLFLDEVGDLAAELQPKLLKVLESKTFRRLGGTREITVDVRLVAATNKDLEEEVRAGRFREDLFYRLNVLPLTLPPLRERTPDDLIELVQRILPDLAARHRIPAPRVSPAALELLMGHTWPGNIRELRNTLERALVLAGGGDTLLPEHLPRALRAAQPAGPARLGGEARLQTLEELERQHLERALALLDGNRTRVAEALGISRATLHNKIKRYQLEAVGRP